MVEFSPAIINNKLHCHYLGAGVPKIVWTESLLRVLLEFTKAWRGNRIHFLSLLRAPNISVQNLFFSTGHFNCIVGLLKKYQSLSICTIGISLYGLIVRWGVLTVATAIAIKQFGSNWLWTFLMTCIWTGEEIPRLAEHWRLWQTETFYLICHLQFSVTWKLLNINIILI